MSAPDPETSFEVGLEDEGERLDVVIGRHLPTLSRRVARKLGLEGKLRLDGRAARPSERVRAGQRIDVVVESAGDPTEVAARILRVTPDFVFVDKPAGVHTHALRPDDPPSLADWVALEHPECKSASDDPREGGAAHRLDLKTSGVVCFARSRETWERARAAFTEGRVVKRYLAVAVDDTPNPTWPPTPEPSDTLTGWIAPWAAPVPALADLLEDVPSPSDPAAQTLRIRAPLGRAEDRRRVAVRLDGDRASTILHPLDRTENRRYLDVTLETGHRHQIRAHLAWLGVPLLGDTLYGGPESHRLHLHAALLAFEDTDISAEAANPVPCPPPEGFWPRRSSDVW